MSKKFPNMFFRALAFIYFCAFSSLYVQFDGILGRNGLEPAEIFLNKFKKAGEAGMLKRFYSYPNLAWFFPLLNPLTFDECCKLLILAGMLLSLVCMSKSNNYSISFGALWISYLSIYSLSQIFLRFQWDILLIECGFLAIWLSKPWHFKFPMRTPNCMILLLRFLLFKLMFMAGVVKIQSKCPTWSNLTALQFHFATQCLPTSFAWYAHQLPTGVALTLFIELAAPFLLLVPFAYVRLIGAFFQLLLQFSILLTGNYTYFNILTMVLCFSIYPLEDKWRSKFFDKLFLILTLSLSAISIYFLFELNQYGELHFKLTDQQFNQTIHSIVPLTLIFVGISFLYHCFYDLFQSIRDFIQQKESFLFLRFFKVFYMFFLISIACIIFSANTVTFTSIDNSLNLSSTMTTLYQQSTKWHITHPYGLFRSMTGIKEIIDENGRKISIVARPEIIIKGSIDRKQWKEYHFKYKPGNCFKAPSFVAPHQPRLDWQMWFAALTSYQQSPWLIHLIDKIFKNSSKVLNLMDQEQNPFKTISPNYIKTSLYYYDFTSWNTSSSRNISSDKKTLLKTKWWTRTKKEDYLPILVRGDKSIQTFLESYEWGTEDFKISTCKKIGFTSLPCLFHYWLEVLDNTSSPPLTIAISAVCILSATSLLQTIRRGMIKNNK